jgi:hypothetical protein
MFPKDDASNAERQTQRAPQATLRSTTQSLHVTPNGGFHKMDIPYTAKTIEKTAWDCHQGCIVQIEHDGDPQCQVGYETEYRDGFVWRIGEFQGSACLITTIPGTSGTSRYRERFLRLPGETASQGISFPRDFVRVFYSFGTNEMLGPVEVVAMATITE